MAKPNVDGSGGKMLERHPLSEKYGPKMSPDELAGLGQDIKAHGQHDDIIMYEGKVLAGWNRYIGCYNQGVKPRLKDMDPNGNPVAVAFGTNFMRRRLSSVQKAFYGAQYAVDTNAKQADVAKMMGCSINRLNVCCQLLRRDDEEAKGAVEELRTNPDLSSGTFDEMMLELGLTKEQVAKPPAPSRTNTHADDDMDEFGGDEDDDLTGGAIDGLLGDGEGDDPLAGEGGDDKPARKQRGEIGEGAAPLPQVGGKRDSLTSATESTVSRMAKAFRNLTADDQRKFIKFSWGKLQQALNAAINAGEVQYYAPGTEPSPGTELMESRKKSKVKGGKDAVDAVAKSGKVDPSLIARGKPATDDGEAGPVGNEDDDLLAGKTKPGAEVGSPFKESAHTDTPAPKGKKAKAAAAEAAAKKAPAKKAPKAEPAAAKAPAKKAAAKAPAKAPAKKAAKK